MHDPCNVPLMKSSRSKTRHRRNRRLLTVALWALVFSSAAVLGSGPHQAQPKPVRVAMALGASGGAPHGAHLSGGGSFQTGAGVLRAPEAGGSHEDSTDDRLIGDNLGPNGENGLAPADHGAGKPDGDKKIDAPGPETFQLAENGGHFGGGFGGVGSGVGGGGSGGGGTGGTDGGQGDPVGAVSKPSPEELPPLQTVVTPPVTDEGGTDPACVLTDTCDPLLPDTIGPPKGADFVGDGDPPGDFTPPRFADLGAPSAAPEPATWLMLLAGFMGLGSALRAQRRKAALA